MHTICYHETVISGSASQRTIPRGDPNERWAVHYQNELVLRRIVRNTNSPRELRAQALIEMKKAEKGQRFWACRSAFDLQTALRIAMELKNAR